MLFKREISSVKEQQFQQLSDLGSVFADYRSSFHRVIPKTTVSTMVAKLDRILHSTHPQLQVGVLFESLNYEVLFTSENPTEQSRAMHLLRVHQQLKVPVDGGKSRKSFLYLLDAAKRAMEAGTLERDTAEDIRFIIQEQRNLFASKPVPNASYGAAGKTRALRELKDNRSHEVDYSPTLTEPVALETPTNHENISVYTRPTARFDTSSISNFLFKSILGGALLESTVNTITATVTPSAPSKSGYITL